MRRFFPSLLILFLATVASGQVAKEQLKEHPTLKIVSFQWWASGGNSFPGWRDGSSNGGIFPNVANWGVASSGSASRSPSSGRGTPFECRAIIKLLNSGSKTIRSVSLDYIFRDKATGEEFLRYQLYANERIESGDTETLEQHIYQKAGKYRKSFRPAEPQLDVVLRTREAEPVVLIRRIEYADGTAQQY